MRVLISAGEASGDLYASRVAEVLKQRHPEAEFFGCAGPRMQAAGVRAVVDQRSLAVVGIVEVLAHIPRIWREFRKLAAAAQREKPDIAILTDSPDFHLRLAKKLARSGVPVVYLIAPQAWAWRPGRVKTLRRAVARLLCIFPFEEPFFRERGVAAAYIGHPLARMVKPSLARGQLCQRLGIPESARILALLPGSRPGEAARHLPFLIQAVKRIRTRQEVAPVVALPAGFGGRNPSFSEPIRAASIQLIEGCTWDVLAHAELALAASGTVTIEAALLGVPMVTFYRVNALSWYLGRWLVTAPFLSMVNLVAGRRIVTELIQRDLTAERLSAEALKLLENPAARDRMKTDLAGVAAALASGRDPMEVAADWVETVMTETVHAQ
jgi:lipid-A-disaccharide synthase